MCFLYHFIISHYHWIIESAFQCDISFHKRQRLNYNQSTVYRKSPKMHSFLVVVIMLCAFVVSTQAYNFSPPRSLLRPLLRMSVDPLTIFDSSYNLAAGSAVIGTICGGLEDIKGNDGKKLPTAKLFGAGALLFTIFGAFIAYQTFTLRFTSTESSFSLIKADGSSTGPNVVVGR